MEKGRAKEAIYLDFCKAFDKKSSTAFFLLNWEDVSLMNELLVAKELAGGPHVESYSTQCASNIATATNLKGPDHDK